MRLVQTITAAVKHNMKPGAVLIAAALATVFSYYNLPAVNEGFQSIAFLKKKYGFAYSAAATALFGGLLPYLYLLFTRQLNRGYYLKDFLFYTVFWAVKGMEVDALYRLQGVLFGYEVQFLVLLKKVLVDQFVYIPLWGGPTMQIAFMWKESGYSLSRLKQELDHTFFTVKLPVLIISNWSIWIIAVSIIYTFPPELQIPMFNLVLCFWVLMMSFLSRQANRDQDNG